MGQVRGGPPEEAKKTGCAFILSHRAAAIPIPSRCARQAEAELARGEHLRTRSAADASAAGRPGRGVKTDE